MSDKIGVVGFWRRAGADTLDGIILAAFGLTLGLAFGDQFSQMGLQGLWIGLVISSAYFGFLHSRVGGGKTLGKRILGIEVLALDGTPLPLGRSYIRFLVIALVTYNGLYAGLIQLFPATISQPFSDVAFLVLVWAFAACYLLVPFHPLRRGLHDLAAGSIVVYSDTFDAEALERQDDPRAARRALIGLTLVSILAAASLLWGLFAVVAKEGTELGPLLKIQNLLKPDFDVRHVNSNSFNGVGPSLNIAIFVPLDVYHDSTKTAQIRLQVKDKLLGAKVDLSKYGEVYESILSGYTIGIASLNLKDDGNALDLNTLTTTASIDSSGSPSFISATSTAP